jgi:hypothetical protein
MSFVNQSEGCTLTVPKCTTELKPEPVTSIYAVTTSIPELAVTFILQYPSEFQQTAFGNIFPQTYIYFLSFHQCDISSTLKPSIPGSNPETDFLEM